LNGERCLPAEARRAEAGTLNGIFEAEFGVCFYSRFDVWESGGV
jgi:hypothetical protein